MLVTVKPVSRKRTRNVGPGRFISQYRRTKVSHAGKQYDLYRPQLTCVLLVQITSTHKTWARMPLLGNVVISKKFLRTRKIMVMHSNEGRV